MINEIYTWVDQIIKHSISIWMAILFLTFIWASTVWSVSKWIAWYKVYVNVVKERKPRK